MGASVIAHDLPVLLLYAAALLLRLWPRKKRAGAWLTLSSAAVAIVATGVALLHGAGLREAAAALIVFLLLNMGVSK